jgi:predicted DNA-binding protein (MmcQ/YjbR family)
VQLADLRETCLNLPGATESFPFGPETPVYKAANGKVFAITTEPDDPEASFTAKADPEDAEALRAQYPAITPGYHMNKRHWVTVLLDGSVPDDLVVEIVAESHRLVAPRIRRPRAQSS